MRYYHHVIDSLHCCGVDESKKAVNALTGAARCSEILSKLVASDVNTYTYIQDMSMHSSLFIVFPQVFKSPQSVVDWFKCGCPGFVLDECVVDCVTEYERVCLPQYGCGISIYAMSLSACIY